MKLKHIKTLLPPQNYEFRILCLAWSPNNKKLAVCTSEKVILVFDENGDRRERFATKAADSKTGKRNYVVKSIVFSADSSKLAVAQSDNIIFVYKFGENWDDKKIICNKFPQQSAVTCVIWPMDQPIVCGLVDGKVRAANTKTNKSSTIYNTESCTVSLATNMSEKGFISGHADGKIIRYFFDDEDSGDFQGKFATHPTAPYALCWAGSTVIAAGCDKRIYVYGRDGSVIQQFDYSRNEVEKAFTVAACGPGGSSVAIGSYDRIRIFTWSPRKGCWDEGNPKEIKNLYTITALAWRRDGSKLTAGTLCGAIEQFDCCTKRRLYKNMFELNYVGPSQVIVNNMKTKDKVIIKSNYGAEIDGLKIIGNDRYLVAHTSDTLIIGDFQKKLFSEVPWQNKGKKEKYYFGSENFCLVFSCGELFLIEFGINEITGSVRTEFMGANHISVRLSDRRKDNRQQINKRIAFLIDFKTISIHDLVSGCNIGQVGHDQKIDWIELNENGRKLLYRDRLMHLFIYDVESCTSFPMLTYCSFVQWVPQSDVVIAQARKNLCVWYNVEATDKPVTVPLKGGDVIGVEKSNGKTEVLVNEGLGNSAYPLDSGLIEFGTAMEDADLARAVSFLESLPALSSETESMWFKLARAALHEENLLIAERCFAALGIVSKARYLKTTRESLEKRIKFQLSEGKKDVDEGGDESIPNIYQNVANDFWARARLAILEKEFKKAETIYLEQNATDATLEMYCSLNKWVDAIEVATAKAWPNIDQLSLDYQKWLNQTGQDEAAAELRVRQKDIEGAINLYLRARMPGKAVRLLLTDSQLLTANRDLTERVAQALVQAELFEKAGDIYRSLGQPDKAMQYYRKAGAYQRAVDLARVSFPSDVVRLEAEWADYLVKNHQLDSAIHHYIEAGKYQKAVLAAVEAQQWTKAAHLLETIEAGTSSGETGQLAEVYRRLAKHYAAASRFSEAEAAFLKADSPKAAIEMYTAAGQWEQAHRVASEAMDPTELTEMYLTQAEELERAGRLKEAERLYLMVHETDRAINMYKSVRQYREMLRLVRIYNPSMLDQTLLSLAQELDSEGNLKQAEQYYTEAGDWKSLVNMYRIRDKWEDAYRVASLCSEHPNELRRQVAYLWARHLCSGSGGGESAVRLLNRLGQLDSSIELAVDACAFEFAFDLARQMAGPTATASSTATLPAGLGPVQDKRLAEVHYKHAMYLEDEGKFSEAEAEFVKAGKPREAVLMYVHQQDWSAAGRIAQAHDPDSLNDVLIGQARLAFAEKAYNQAEALLLRAQRPDMAVRAYREAGLWEEAMRVAREYLPSRVQALKEEYEEEKLHGKVDHLDEPRFSTDTDDRYGRRLQPAGDKSANTPINVGSHGGPAKGSPSADGASITPAASDAVTEALEQTMQAARLQLASAREFEARGDRLRAIEILLKMQPPASGALAAAAEVKGHLLIYEKAWIHASRLAENFLSNETIEKVSELAATRLMTIKRYGPAGELYLTAGRMQQAVEAFIAGEEWTKARRVARELEPRLEEYVEAKYKGLLKSTGQADALASLDLLSALDMLADQGCWDKCLAMAEQHAGFSASAKSHGSKSNGVGSQDASPSRAGSSMASEAVEGLRSGPGYQLLHKYVATYATRLIHENRIIDALMLYKKYGAPAYPQNFNIYKRIFQDLAKQRDLFGPEAYPTWAALRGLIDDIVCNITSAKSSGNNGGSGSVSAGQRAGGPFPIEILDIFNRMLLVAHYYAIRSAVLTVTNSADLMQIAAKLSISLLRHSDIIPADKAFYEAGINCREQGWTSMAFVFLNRYLDLVEAIEDPKNLASALDSSDLQETDIPLEVPLPEEAYTNQEEHESVREWILAVSMDHKLEQSLPCDERGIYVAALSTPKSQGPTALPCLITGYPILQPAGEIRFQNSNRVANRRDWNSFEAACRAARTAECIDTMDFLKRWCGSAVNADVAVKF